MNTFRNGDKAYTVGDIEKMEARIKELVRFISENTPLLSYLAIETVSSRVDGDQLFRFKDWLATRDLEQQAKGIKDAIEYLGWEDIYTATCPNKKVSNELRFVAGQLSKEAQALKERG